MECVLSRRRSVDAAMKYAVIARSFDEKGTEI